MRGHHRRAPVVLAFLLGILIATAGSAGASRLITGHEVKDGSIGARDLSPALRRELRRRAARGPAGPRGATGARGGPGAAGADGARRCGRRPRAGPRLRAHLGRGRPLATRGRSSAWPTPRWASSA